MQPAPLPPLPPSPAGGPPGAPRAKVFAALPDPAGLEGTFCTSGSTFKVLFDTGASHCFISRHFVERESLVISSLSPP